VGQHLDADQVAQVPAETSPGVRATEHLGPAVEDEAEAEAEPHEEEAEVGEIAHRPLPGAAKVKWVPGPW
jgi:hypothetical protein